MNDTQLDGYLLSAVREGNGTREKLMRIDSLRQRTWAVVGQRLDIMTKRGALVSSKAGWRLAK